MNGTTKNEMVEFYWISEKTGELQETLRGVIKCAFTDFWKCHFLNLKWKRCYWDGAWHDCK